MLITSIRIPNAHVISPHFFEFFFFHLPELISCHRQNGANECVDDHTEGNAHTESFVFEKTIFHMCHRQNGANECVDDHTERSQQAESFDHTEDADEAQHLVLA